MTATSRDLSVPDSALVIVAHPDDAEFQCGATLAKWAASGTRIHHLVLTDGSKGTWDPGADQSALVATREGEQRRAAEILGGGDVTFLRRVDGELSADETTVAEVCDLLRRLKPSVVLSHDPWKRYRLHPDHAAAGQVCIRAVVAARDPFFHLEQLDAGLTVHRPDHLLLFEPDEVNHVEAIVESHMDTRVAALEAHVSQLETTHFYRLDGHREIESALVAFRNSQHESARAAGSRHGVVMAEEFHRITDQL